MNLSLSKRNKYIYNIILIIINKYIKMIRYLLINKIIKVLNLKKLLIKKIFLKFNTSNDIIINR